MRRQQQQARQDPLPELLYQVPVAEIRVDPPVRGDRAEIDDPDVPSRRPAASGCCNDMK